MSRSAQIILTGEQHKKASPPLIAPVISFSFPDLSWVYTESNPPIWSVQESDNGASGWIEVDTVVGTARSRQFTDSGTWVRIIGLTTPGGSEVTAGSNSIFVNF